LELDSKELILNSQYEKAAINGGSDLQEENRRLKQMYAELMLDHQLAKKIIEKKL